MLDSKISPVPAVYLYVGGRAGLIFFLPIIPGMDAESKDGKSTILLSFFKWRILGNEDSTQQTVICQSDVPVTGGPLCACVGRK